MEVSNDFVVALGVVLSICSYVWIYRSSRSSRPGPESWPLVGCIPLLTKNWARLHDFFFQFFESGNDTMWVGLAFGNECVFIAEPSLIEHVVKTNFANYPKGREVVRHTDELLGEGIFNADDDAWKLQRKVASYQFSHATLRDHSSLVFKECALRLLKTVAEFAEPNRSMDFQDLALRMTLETTVKLGFGVELGCLTPLLPAVPFAVAFDRANELSFHRYRDPLWQLKRAFSVGVEKELKDCLKVIDSFSYDVISWRRKEIKDAEQLAMAKPKPDLLSRFLSAMTERSDQCSDQYLRDIIVNFIIAGRDTTGVTLSWFIYCMCLHPEVERKILAEIHSLEKESTIQDEKGSSDVWTRFVDILTCENLGKLHYLHAALSETLRLFPPVPQDGKTVLADDLLPNGTRVKKGQTITYSTYGMARLERVWGADAKEFKPERWLKNGKFQPESPYKFSTFHAGPRACLGKDSAYLQLKLTGALLLRFFKFELVPDHTVTYRVMLILLIKNGLHVTASPRDPSVPVHRLPYEFAQ